MLPLAGTVIVDINWNPKVFGLITISLKAFMTFFAPDQDLSLQTEGEIQPEDYPRDIGILSKYVDDFLSAEDQTSDGTLPVNSKMLCRSK